jgi:hypothetical protein
MTDLEELASLCGSSKEFHEGSRRYLYLAIVMLPNGEVVKGLLCPQERDGYETRLFLSARYSKGNNWTEHRILDRVWYTWSQKGVPADQRSAQILAQHLANLR